MHGQFECELTIMMYLVHVYLRPSALNAVLPDEAAAAITDSCRGQDGFEHASVHIGVPPYPVVGLYVRAVSLEAAEEAAAALWRHASSVHESLGGWELVRAEVPILRFESEPRDG